MSEHDVTSQTREVTHAPSRLPDPGEDSFTTVIRAYEDKIAALERRLAAEIETSAALSAQLNQRETLLSAVYNSTSWRLTSPIRALRDAMRRMPSPRRPAVVLRKMPAPPPTIFIECTHTFHTDLNTGIQRVVRNIVRNSAAVAAERGFAVAPVIYENGQFIVADQAQILADKRRNGTHSNNGGKPKSETSQSCSLRPGESLDNFASMKGSILLMLDSSWGVGSIWPGVQRFKAAGGRVASTIYDLIPITHPATCVPELIAAFEAWTRTNLRTSDGFVCISRSVAGQLADFVASDTSLGLPPDSVKISHFYLGSELDFIEKTDAPSSVIESIFSAPHHVFLMVGSIEPRKNHAFVLDAFERFWQQGGQGSLVIIGRHGWKTDAFQARVTEHPEWAKRLFLVRNASDADLEFSYHRSSALIIASEIEGFGLPVVESFQRGLPVLCSDIPVFREIAEGKATFFDLADPSHLTDALLSFCRNAPRAADCQRVHHPWINWRQSAEQLFDAMLDALNMRRQAGPSRKGR